MRKIIIIASMFLAGCSAFNAMTGNVYAPKTAEWVSSNAKVNEDVFTKTTRINFPSLIPRHFLNYKQVTGLSAWSAPNSPFWVTIIKGDDQKDLYVVYMDIKKDDWGFYSGAYDEKGNKLHFITIDQTVNSGNKYQNVSVNEFFGIEISKEWLEKNKGNNPQIKVVGKSDNFVIFLPDYYIDGILEYISK